MGVFGRILTTPARKETAHLGAIEVFFWAGVVNFEAFMVPWLRGNGYSPSQAGMVVAVVFGCAIVGQPLLGAVSDRVASPGRMVAAAIALGIASFLAMPLVVEVMPLLVVMAILYSLAIASLPAVLDAWILARREKVPGIHYGIARAAGSFGFAVGGIILGYLADRIGVTVMFPAFAATTAIAAVLSLAAARPPAKRDIDTAAPVSGSSAASPIDVPPSDATDDAAATDDDIITVHIQHLPVSALAPSGQTAKEHLRGAAKAVLSNRPYLVLLAGAFLGFSGLRAALTFLPYLFESVGGTVGDVGVAHSIGALSEVPFFVGAAVLHRRIRGAPLVAIVLFILGVRLFTYTWMATPTAILALQLTHGLTFGVFTATSVDYIHRIAPPEHRGFFQALAPSVYFGLGSIVGSWLGGVLLEATSLVWLYRIAAAAAFLGAPIPLFTGRSRRPTDA